MQNRRNPLSMILLLALSLILNGMLPLHASAATSTAAAAAAATDIHAPAMEICSSSGVAGAKQLPENQKNRLHNCCKICGGTLPPMAAGQAAHRQFDSLANPVHAAIKPSVAPPASPQPADAQPRAPPAFAL